MENLANVMWPFGPHRAECGVTVVHPGSRHGGAGDASPIGDARLVLGSALHGAGANLGNYEGQRPSVLLSGEPDEYLGAIDELLPRQAAALWARAKEAGYSGGVTA